MTTMDRINTSVHLDIQNLNRTALLEILNREGPDRVETTFRNALGSSLDGLSDQRIGELERCTRTVWQLTDALISDDPAAGARYVQDLMSSGVRHKELYVVYLAGAARLLGDWWDESRVSFFDVGIATSRIHSILRKLETTSQPRVFSPLKSALFAAVPGETHMIGVKIAADVFRREGWDIDLCLGLSSDELIARVLEREHRIVGLSCSGTHSTASLRQCVKNLRVAAPDIKILLCGKVVQCEGDDIDNLEIDEVAGDMLQALKAMNDFQIAAKASCFDFGNPAFDAIR